MADLGLESSEDEGSVAPVAAPAVEAPPLAAPNQALLGLESSDEEADPVPAPGGGPPSGSLPVRDGLGLDSDEDDEGEDGFGSQVPGTGLASRTNPVVARQKKAVEQVAYGFEVPSLPRPAPGTQVFVGRMPAQLGIQSSEFSPTTVEPATQELNNCVLWRFKRDEHGEVMRGAKGEPLRESNSRLVKWSDGTLQLIVGSEVYEAAKLRAEHSYLYAKQGAVAKDGSSTTLLECHGPIDARLGLRLTTMDPEILKKLRQKSLQQATKASRIQVYSSSTTTPAALKPQHRKRPAPRKAGASSQRSGTIRPGLNRSFLEDGVPSHGGRDHQLRHSYLDEPDEEDDAFIAPSDEEEVNSGDLEEEEEEEEEAGEEEASDEDDEQDYALPRKKHRAAAAAQALNLDDDE